MERAPLGRELRRTVERVGCAGSPSPAGQRLASVAPGILASPVGELHGDLLAERGGLLATHDRHCRAGGRATIAEPARVS